MSEIDVSLPAMRGFGARAERVALVGRDDGATDSEFGQLLANDGDEAAGAADSMASSMLAGILAESPEVHPDLSQLPTVPPPHTGIMGAACEQMAGTVPPTGGLVLTTPWPTGGLVTSRPATSVVPVKETDRPVASDVQGAKGVNTVSALSASGSSRIAVEAQASASGNADIANSGRIRQSRNEAAISPAQDQPGDSSASPSQSAPQDPTVEETAVEIIAKERHLPIARAYEMAAPRREPRERSDSAVVQSTSDLSVLRAPSGSQARSIAQIASVQERNIDRHAEPKVVTEQGSSAVEFTPATGGIAQPLARLSTADPSLHDQIEIALLEELRHVIPAAATLPRPAAEQITRVIEIALRPEELGHVHVRLKLDGRDLQVQLSAERPETVRQLEQVRGSLAEVLRDAGYVLDRHAVQSVAATGTPSEPQSSPAGAGRDVRAPASDGGAMPHDGGNRRRDGGSHGGDQEPHGGARPAARQGAMRLGDGVYL